MDYEAARRFLIEQSTETIPDSVLSRLQQGQPPIPGQVTTTLLALKVVFDSLRGAKTLDRELASALFLLSYDARQQFDAGLRRSLDCPPLLNEDLDRIAKAAKSIFSGTTAL